MPFISFRTLSVVLALSCSLSYAENLALNRPVTVSSTAWAPTPAEFAVDGENDTGWRAGNGDNQWIEVNLQGNCQVAGFHLVSEATKDAQPFTGRRLDTTGKELFSSCATSYTLQVSTDDKTWTDVFTTTEGKGGTEDITLKEPVTASYVRMQILKRSSSAPIGLNEFQVLGTCTQTRPVASGWTTRRVPKKTTAPALTTAEDGSLPILSGWDLTCQNWLTTTDGATLSKPGLDTHQWYDASLPSTVLGTLVDQGVFPDPAYGLANLKIPEALCRRSWWYRRAFSVPSDFNIQSERQVWLEMDGVHHTAEVWFNGTKLGDLEAFRRGRFNITALLQPPGTNVLAVKVTPPPFPGSPGDKGTDGNAWVNSIQMGLDEPTFLCSSGWDWIPAIRDRGTGIIDGVRLRNTGPVLIGDPQVETTLPVPTDPSLADVSLTVPVSNPGTQEEHVTVIATITPTKPGTSTDPAALSQNVTVPAGGSVDVAFTPDKFPTLAIHNPQLWWPNGYGQPNLQLLNVDAKVAGIISDSHSMRIGLRDLRAVTNLDTSGDSYGKTIINFPTVAAHFVRINCLQRTTQYGYSLWDFSVFNTDAPTQDLALKHPVTASSSENGKGPEHACDGDSQTRWASEYSDAQWIAVNLGSSQNINRVTLRWEIAAAKSYVVQVSDDGQQWKDVKAMTNDSEAHPSRFVITVNGVRIFCRGGNWGYDELLRRGGQARMDTAVRMHREANYTMIRNWIGSTTRPEFFDACDENGILVFNDFWVSGYGGGAPLQNSGRHQLFLDTARDSILRYRSHPSIAFWVGCNESSPPGEVNDGLKKLVAQYDSPRVYCPDSASNLLTGHGPYSWTEPRNYNGDGFHSEIGMPTVPVADSMRRLAGDQPAWPISGVWNYHDWCPGGGQSSNGYRDAMQARLGQATDLDDFCTKAQFINYESMRAIYESANHKLWNDASAVLIWMSHPAWMSTTWQTYDYDFEVNGSYFGAQKACEPVHIQASLKDWSIDALNHTSEKIPNVTVTATCYDLNGKQLGEVQTTQADLPVSSVTPIFSANWPTDAPPLHLLRLEMRSQNGKVLSDNTYWRYKRPEDMQSLNALQPTCLTVTAASQGDGKRTWLRTTITNSGLTVAPMVTLSLRRAGDGSRVLPAFYSDGDFWLLPGEKRTVTIDCATADLKGDKPAVKVSAYHVPEVTAISP